MVISNKKIVITTHQMVYGAAHALKDYLNKKQTKQLLFIAHPINPVTNYSEQRVFKQGKEKKTELVRRNHALRILNYLLDSYYTFYWILSNRIKFDLFIGVDNLNCAAGLLLKKLGRVERVVYYSIDFSPIRFRNRLLNYIYHLLEKLCVQHADEVWNVSPRIAEGREEFLGLLADRHPQKVVPIGVWNKKVQKTPFSKINKQQVLFVGHLLEKQGVQKVLDAIPLIVKDIKDFRFVIVGGGEYKMALKKKVKNLKIEKYVEFYGWIKSRSKLDSVMSLSACAVASYKPEDDRLYNFTYYADPTKIKDYLSAGLPVILTDVSYNARLLEKMRCGIIVDYNHRQIAKAVAALLLNKRRLKQYRQNALKLVQQFEWEVIFNRAFAHEE